MSCLRFSILQNNAFGSFIVLEKVLHVKELLNLSMPIIGHIKGTSCKQ